MFNFKKSPIENSSSELSTTIQQGKLVVVKNHELTERTYNNNHPNYPT